MATSLAPQRVTIKRTALWSSASEVAVRAEALRSEDCSQLALDVCALASLVLGVERGAALVSRWNLQTPAGALRCARAVLQACEVCE